MYPENILSLIGNTPLVEIKRLNPHPNVKILAKLESFNPGGSIKDRVALRMIESAEQRGELTPDKTVIEATSGNTGIGLAMVCAVKGYKLMLLMPESASEERRRIMRAYGAGIKLTPARLATDGAIEEAYRLAREEPDKYLLVDQYNNPASVEAHYMGTGLEIWEQTGGNLTHVVACLGTSGTCMGLVKRMKEMNPEIRVAAMEPYAGHKIQGLKNMLESYPPGIFDRKAPDMILHVEDEEAFDLCRRLAGEEGIFAGMSSGAALAASLKLAATLESGTIVTIFPDGGERYLSTPLFAPPAQRGATLYDVAEKKQTPPPAGAGFYAIGPSPDEPGDPDAWRRIILLDVLSRHLAAKGVHSPVRAGVADLDDRALDAARRAGLSRAKFSKSALDAVSGLGKALGVSKDTGFVPASDSTATALDLCRKLLGKGRAYEKLRSVYFDVGRDKEYGSLSDVDPSTLHAGKTVDLESYSKDNPRDFTLLKRASLQDLKQGDVLETEWGNVRPSWFLQHGAAALDSLPGVGVVMAGETQRFPHLENLRAIWAAAGVRPGVWAVARSVEREDGFPADMAALAENETTQCPRALRMWLLSGSYRKPLALTSQSLAMWVRNWRKVQDAAVALASANAPKGEVSTDVKQAVFDLRAGLDEALDNDLSLHRFWPVMFKFVRLVNTRLKKGLMTSADCRACLDRLKEADEVLAILDTEHMPLPEDALSPEASALVAERETARKNKNFAHADQLRDQLLAMGLRIEDSPAGPRVFPAG